MQSINPTHFYYSSTKPASGKASSDSGKGLSIKLTKKYKLTIPTNKGVNTMIARTHNSIFGLLFIN